MSHAYVKFDLLHLDIRGLIFFYFNKFEVLFLLPLYTWWPIFSYYNSWL